MHNGHFLQLEHVMWNPSATAGLRQKVFSFENLCRFCGSIQKELKVLQEIKRWIFGKIAFDPTPLIFRNLVSIFFRKTSEKKNNIKVQNLQQKCLDWKWPPKDDCITTEKAPSLSKLGAMARIVHLSLVWRTGGIEGLGQSQFPAWQPPRQPPWQPSPLSQCVARWALWFEDSVETSEAFEVDVTFDLRNVSSSKKEWLLFYCCGDHAAFDFGVGNRDHFKLMRIYITFNLALNRKYENIVS